MTIPAGFQFSQGSLQDFLDCRRRFQLRYLEKRAWPAVQTEPVLESEHNMRLGQRFHHMLHQHLLGIPAEALSRQVDDDELSTWWGNYLRFSQDAHSLSEFGGLWGPDVRRYPERSLMASLDGFRLVAQYDLILAFPTGRFLIVDWKTARRRPRRTRLAERVQTRLYPYLLVRAGAEINRRLPVAPENVSMIYWFAGFPEQPERFDYDLTGFQQDETTFQTILSTLERLGEQDFEKTSDEKRCAFCKYRSLCERGVRAGSLDDHEDLDETDGDDLDIDFDQIAEIEF